MNAKVCVRIIDEMLEAALLMIKNQIEQSKHIK